MVFKIKRSLLCHQIKFFIEARNADNMCMCIYVCLTIPPPVMNMAFHEMYLVMMSSKLQNDSIISINEGHMCTIHKVCPLLYYVV